MRMKLRAMLAAVLMSTGLVAVVARPAAADRVGPPNVGVMFHGLWDDYDDATRIAVLDKLAAAHVSWVRVDVGWRNAEPRRGQRTKYYVDRFNWVVNQARARGLKVLAVVFQTPAWANGGKDMNAPPDNPADFARFARWLAKTFRDRVAAWEIWNEPTAEEFWDADAARYAELVRAAYPAFKAGDPKATVVAGSTIYNDSKWLAEAYDAGMGGYFDALSTHPYMGPLNSPPELVDIGVKWRMDHVRAVRELMVARGDASKPIWFTEFGWTAHDNAADTPPWEYGVTEAEQAEYLVRALALMGREYPYVTHAFWYNERNKDQVHPKEDNAGLLRRDLSEKPAYHALKSALNGTATPPGDMSSYAAPPAGGPAAAASSDPLEPRLWWLAFLVPLFALAVFPRRFRGRPFSGRRVHPFSPRPLR